MCFIVLGCIWQSFVNRRNSVQNGLKWCNYCTSLCHEVASEFFTMNTPDPPHWTLSFVAFGWFYYCIKLGVKRAELEQLMQKFVPRSRNGICRNERARSTPLDPKCMFLVHLIVFGCIWQCFVTTQDSVQNGSNWYN